MQFAITKTPGFGNYSDSDALIASLPLKPYSSDSAGWRKSFAMLQRQFDPENGSLAQYTIHTDASVHAAH